MQKVTLHTYNADLGPAYILRMQKDSLESKYDVWIVFSEYFESELEFYMHKNDEGKRTNVGNNAYWITLD